MGVFRHNAVEPSRCVTVRGLDLGARYAVKKGLRRKLVAELTGRELEERGFQVEFPSQIDGELFEISRVGNDDWKIIQCDGKVVPPALE